MPSESVRYPECTLIEEYVRELAPIIDSVQCGRRLDDAYHVWFRLDPTAGAKQLTISKEEYKSGQWKKKIQVAIEDANE